MYSEEHIKNKIEDCITEIKPFLKNIKDKTLIKKISKAIYDYNIALYNYNKRNGKNYQGIGNSFRKAGVEGTENKFSVKSCFNY